MTIVTQASITSLSATLAVALMAATVAPATAHAETETRSVAVAFADLDLATAEGHEKLERRIARAARDVCGLDEVATGTRLRSKSARDCYDQSLRDIRTRVARLIDRERQGA